MATTRPCGVHLTGSVALADADEVFRTGGSILGRHLRRIPDGETGPRANWIGWQVPVLAAMPGIEMGAPKIQPGYDLEYPQLQLADGASPADTELGPLGYAANALESYKTFTTVRSEGVLPADCRFQVSLPTPLALAAVFFVERDRAALEDMYEERMYREIDEITAAIPHQDLAIQWDVAVEFAILENLLTGYDDPRKDVLDRLVRVSSYVPADAQVGFHLCYGSVEDKHFKEPADAGVLADVANGLAEGLDRSLNWIHLPVPIDRDDEAYFEPLGGLKLHPETELYLGLIHLDDGAEGAGRRIAAAQRSVESFGVATECGLGRRAPETIPQWMQLHADVADPVR